MNHKILLRVTAPTVVGHHTQASELLGLSRATRRHKLRALGMAVGRTVVEDEPNGRRAHRSDYGRSW